MFVVIDGCHHFSVGTFHLLWLTVKNGRPVGSYSLGWSQKDVKKTVICPPVAKDTFVKFHKMVIFSSTKKE